MNAAAEHTTNLAVTEAKNNLRIMGLPFLDCSLETAAHIISDAAAGNINKNIYFVNAHCVNIASRDKSYKGILSKEDFLFADGAGMEVAALIEGNKLNHNVNGTDLFPVICAEAASRNLTIALLGAAPGIAKACADKMMRRFAGLEIVSTHDGYLQEEDELLAIDEINASGASMLFVAKGVPMQEQWMTAHRNRITVPVVLGVGALFDFYSGAVPRAPEIWQKLRIEWVYRLLQEPKRMFRRYIIGNPQFIVRAIWKRVTGDAG